MNDDSLFAQLMKWQARGFMPELHPVLNNQWVLVISTDHWSMRSRLDEHSQHMGIRFNTDPQPTPQAAIRAAMEIIR
jgi:hypothetical protein